MVQETQTPITIKKDRHPGLLWIVGWALLTTVAIPLALIGMPPVAAGGIWLSNLGVRAAVWAAPSSSVLEGSGMLLCLALALAFFQWLMLRKWLPQAWQWSLRTLFGLLLGSLVNLLFFRIFHIQWISKWTLAVPLLTVGLVLGLAHWLYLRRFLSQTGWIILIDVLAAGSLLLLGQPVTNLAGLSVLILLGVVSGLGMLLLLKQSHLQPVEQVGRGNRKRWIWVGLSVVALIPLFFGCLWVYAASQLALAKNDGIYPTVEEAVIATNSKGWGGAKVISVEDIHTGPNRFDGSQPHVWFGGARVHYDRIPQGGRHDWDLAGSFYIHVRAGWVFVPEGAFPEFIGWMMELYHMEGLDEYRQTLGEP